MSRRLLSAAELQAVREMRADHLEKKAEVVEIERQILTLMQRREDLLGEMAHTTFPAMAAKLECATGTIRYACIARSPDQI